MDAMGTPAWDGIKYGERRELLKWTLTFLLLSVPRGSIHTAFPASQGSVLRPAWAHPHLWSQRQPQGLNAGTCLWSSRDSSGKREKQVPIILGTDVPAAWGPGNGLGSNSLGNYPLPHLLLRHLSPREPQPRAKETLHPPGAAPC